MFTIVEYCRMCAYSTVAVTVRAANFTVIGSMQTLSQRDHHSMKSEGEEHHLIWSSGMKFLSYGEMTTVLFGDV